jgi:hypothetical protein
MVPWSFRHVSLLRLAQARPSTLTIGSHARLCYCIYYTTPSANSSYSSILPQDTPDSTISAMPATKIDGTAIAKSIREKINADIRQKQQSNPRYKPCLVIVQGLLYSIV